MFCPESCDKYVLPSQYHSDTLQVKEQPKKAARSFFKNHLQSQRLPDPRYPPPRFPRTYPQLRQFHNIQALQTQQTPLCHHNHNRQSAKSQYNEQLQIRNPTRPRPRLQILLPRFLRHFRHTRRPRALCKVLHAGCDAHHGVEKGCW
jgi:hypothetical protein